MGATAMPQLSHSVGQAFCQNSHSPFQGSTEVHTLKKLLRAHSVESQITKETLKSSVTVLKRSIPIIASWSGVRGWELASRITHPNSKKDPVIFSPEDSRSGPPAPLLRIFKNHTGTPHNAGGQWGSTGEVSQHNYIPTLPPGGEASPSLSRSCWSRQQSADRR